MKGKAPVTVNDAETPVESGLKIPHVADSGKNNEERQPDGRRAQKVRPGVTGRRKGASR